MQFDDFIFEFRKRFVPGDNPVIKFPMLVAHVCE
jgi:hypothetical protein